MRNSLTPFKSSILQFHLILCHFGQLFQLSLYTLLMRNITVRKYKAGMLCISLILKTVLYYEMMYFANPATQYYI